jgi:hypothetical protein
MKYTSQEIFDTVVKHLRTQQAKSVALNPDGSAKIKNGKKFCMYRSQDGKMRCAAGAVITDEEYDPTMEHGSIHYIIHYFNLVNLRPHEQLLSRLQGVHDNFPVEKWELELKNAAEDYQVIYTPPNV